MDRPEPRLAWLIGAFLFVYYLLTLGGHHYSVDGIVMFESARQLFFRHSLTLDPPVRWGPDVFTGNPFSTGLMLAYLPVLAVMSPLFYRVPSLQRTPFDPSIARNPELYGNAGYLLCAWLNPLLTALTGSLVFVIGRRLGLTPGWSVAAALAYGMASPAAPYARYDFAQPLATLALTTAVWALLDTAREGRLRSLAALLVALAAMLVTRPDLGVVIPWMAICLAFASRRAGWLAGAARVLPVVLLAAAGVAVYFWSHHVPIEDWTRVTRVTLAKLFVKSRSEAAKGALGLLLSPAHGLLIFAPLAWLAVPGLFRLVRVRQPAGALWAGITAALLLLYAPYFGWWGGWSWGPRFLIPLLPLLALAAAYWAFAARSPWATVVFAALGVAGVAVSWSGILFDVVLYHRWLHVELKLPETAATQFDPAASPLISGWRFLRTTQVDLLLLRMGEFAGPLGTIAAILVAAPLLAALAWLAHLIRAALRAE